MYEGISRKYNLSRMEEGAIAPGREPVRSPRSAQEMRALRDDIMSRPELADMGNVRTGRVYLIGASGTWTNPKYLIGLSYLKGWFHPGLFEDMDPEAIHHEYLGGFRELNYTLSKHGVFVYQEGGR